MLISAIKILSNANFFQKKTTKTWQVVTMQMFLWPRQKGHAVLPCYLQVAAVGTAGRSFPESVLLWIFLLCVWEVWTTNSSKDQQAVGKKWEMTVEYDSQQLEFFFFCF